MEMIAASAVTLVDKFSAATGPVHWLGRWAQFP